MFTCISDACENSDFRRYFLSEALLQCCATPSCLALEMELPHLWPTKHQTLSCQLPWTVIVQETKSVDHDFTENQHVWILLYINIKLGSVDMSAVYKCSTSTIGALF